MGETAFSSDAEGGMFSVFSSLSVGAKPALGGVAGSSGVPRGDEPAVALRVSASVLSSFISFISFF